MDVNETAVNNELSVKSTYDCDEFSPYVVNQFCTGKQDIPVNIFLVFNDSKHKIIIGFPMFSLI